MITRTTRCNPGLVGVALASWLIAVPASAEATVDYAIETGGAHTNNINRDIEDGLDETAAIVGLDFDLTADTRRIDSTITLDIEQRIYTKDTNDDETLGSFTGSIDFSLVENYLDWRVEDTFGQVLNNVFAPDNPQNREDVNVFTTGPVLSLGLGANNQVSLSALYRDVSFEDSPQNNDGVTGRLSLIRNISRNRNLSINVTNGTVNFDREIDTDFDRRSATVAFSSQTSRSSLNVEIGRNEIIFDTDREDRDGTEINVAFQRTLNSRVQFAATYVQQLSDSAQLFQQFLADRNIGNFAGDGVGNPATDQNALADPLEQRSGGVTLTLDQRNGSIFASARLFDFDFDESDLQDRDGYQITLGANRNLPGGWRVGLSGSLNQNQFSSGRDDDNLQVRLNVSKQLTRTLSISSSVAHIERDSNAGGQSFDEDVVRLTLVWQPTSTRGSQ
ncbi:MAG: outer membrane beta-barrel protein [Pseudomonadota bacterium]